MGIILVVLGIILGAVILAVAWAAYFDINLDPDSHKH